MLFSPVEDVSDWTRSFVGCHSVADSTPIGLVAVSLRHAASYVTVEVEFATPWRATLVARVDVSYV